MVLSTEKIPLGSDDEDLSHGREASVPMLGGNIAAYQLVGCRRRQDREQFRGAWDKTNPQPSRSSPLDEVDRSPVDDHLRCSTRWARREWDSVNQGEHRPFRRRRRLYHGVGKCGLSRRNGRECIVPSPGDGNPGEAGQRQHCHHDS